MLVRQGDVSGPDAFAARSRRHQGLYVPLVFATGGTRAHWGREPAPLANVLDLEG